MSAASFGTSWRDDAEVIGMVGLAHGTSHFFHLMLPPLFPWLMRDFGLGYTQAGFLMTVFFVVSGAGQALAGFVVDRAGARPVLFFGLAALSCSGVALALADSYAGLLLAAAVAGMGNAVFHPADFTLLNRRVSPPRLGHAFSVHGLAGNLGWAAGPVFMTGIAAVAGWHATGAAAAGVGGIVLALLVARRHVLDDRSVEAVLAPRSGRAMVETGHFAFLRAGAVWMCFVFFLLTTGAFGVLQNYSPAILSHVYGLSLVLATAGLTAYLLGGAAGMVAGGFIAARGPASDLVIACALTGAAAVALLLASAAVPAWSVLALMGMMGFGVGVAGPSRDLLVRQAATARFGKAAFGRVYGFVYSGLDIGLAASPLVFGPLLDAGRFQAALVGIACLQAAALLAAVRVGRGTRTSAAGA